MEQTTLTVTLFHDERLSGFHTEVIANRIHHAICELAKDGAIYLSGDEIHLSNVRVEINKPYIVESIFPR